MMRKTKRLWITATIALLAVLSLSVVLLWPKISNKYQIWRADKEKANTLAAFEDQKAPPQNVADRSTGSNQGTVETGTISEDNNNLSIKDDPNATDSPKKQPVFKEQVNLDVQFIAQAPISADPAYWAEHKESCEEAATLMAHNFIVGKKTTPVEADRDIYALVHWQKDNFGDEHDIYPDEVKKMAQGYWHHKSVLVIKNATLPQIKEQISDGYPVIVPTIAKYLNNPRYYDRDYHMILAKGYTKDKIITHDNGTTWGADYVYTNEQLMRALDAAGGSVVVIRS